MKLRTRALRLLGGLGLVLVVLAVGFWITLALIPTYGATAEEQQQTLTGDDILKTPIVNWIHATTINAKPEAVWPWIIQMGDDRAGFYSYMFIERMIDPSSPYVNADRVHAEWQNPPKGQRMINKQINILDYQPGEYLLAAAPDTPGALGWTWLWKIAPTAEGKTRLVVHMRIQTPDGASPAALKAFVSLGAFIMERNLISGLKLRAEGGSEPAWTEPVEIALWFATLLVGLAAAVRFLTVKAWQQPLVVGVLSVAALLALTFLQPAIWLRVLMLLALIAGLVWRKGWAPVKVPARTLQSAG